MVTIPPFKFFVERIGGDTVDVKTLIGESADPHTFQLRPTQVTALGSSDLFLTVGLGFEQSFLGSVEKTLPEMTMFDLSTGLELIGKDSDHQDHDGDGGYDPHYWMGYAQCLQIADSIQNILITSRPEHQELYKANYRTLVQEMTDQNETLKEQLKSVQGKTLLVYHGAFAYFAESYGLIQKTVETGGREPTPKQLETLIRESLETEISVVFVQPQYSRAGAEVLADALGGTVIPVSHLAEDWIGNMKKIGDLVSRELQK